MEAARANGTKGAAALRVLQREVTLRAGKGGEAVNDDSRKDLSIAEHEAIETTDLCTAVIGGKEDAIRGWLKNKQIADVNTKLNGSYPVHHAGVWTRTQRACSSVSAMRNRTTSLRMVQQWLRV